MESLNNNDQESRGNLASKVHAGDMPNISKTLYKLSFTLNYATLH